MSDETDRPYAGQETDINDKLVLDLAWERQQKKVRCQHPHKHQFVKMRGAAAKRFVKPGTVAGLATASL